MCGITGFVGEHAREIVPVINGVLEHRGPDDSGFFFDDDNLLGLGHKRLSILDITFGHQPFCNEDNSVALAYNGEIFNAVSLRRKLEGLGRSFRTDHSDTEVLLRMYEHFGMEMLNELNGMFSFVIYDKRRQKIFGARDIFGIKPLYYSNTAEHFAFSSEVKALLAIPGFEKIINHVAVSHYLSFQCIPAPLSIYHNICKLPAAHFFEYDLKLRSLSTERYWQPEFSNVAFPEEELLELVRSKVKNSVERWSISDVEIGCSLSSGLDSSVITMLATQNQSKLRTYTLGFEGFETLDERNASRQLAGIYGTNHNEIILSENDFAQSLPSMIHALDEPYAGGLPSWFIYREMHKDLKVCLTGTGGDELFGNYGKWRMFNNFRDYLYTMRTNHSRLSLTDIFKNPQGSYYYKFFTEREKKTILARDLTSSSSGIVQQYWSAFNSKNVENSVVSVDIQLQLPEEFLMMTDRMSMAFSMEARTPFLDRELATFIFSLDPKKRTSKSDPKSLLRKAFAKNLPQHIIDSPKKGFVLPLDQWTRKIFSDDIRELFDDRFLIKQGIFKPGLKQVFAGSGSSNGFYTDKMWTLLMFQFWYKYAFLNQS
jgi:asparagine synthase (glutamine-hydrolysing)